MVYFEIYHYGKISTLKLRDISLGVSQCDVVFLVDGGLSAGVACAGFPD